MHIITSRFIFQVVISIVYGKIMSCRYSQHDKCTQGTFIYSDLMFATGDYILLSSNEQVKQISPSRAVAWSNHEESAEGHVKLNVYKLRSVFLPKTSNINLQQFNINLIKTSAYFAVEIGFGFFTAALQDISKKAE